jgi:antitoxin ParD1/3/4
MSARTLQLSLPDELAAEIAAAVARGEYGSEKDAILGAVAEWRTRRQGETREIEEWRGLWREEIDAGPGRFELIEDMRVEARRWN